MVDIKKSVIRTNAQNKARKDALGALQAAMDILETTKEERATLWAIVKKNKRLLGEPRRVTSNETPPTPRVNSKTRKSEVRRILKAVDRALDAETQTKIENTHKQSGYSSFMVRVPGSFEGGAKK